MGKWARFGRTLKLKLYNQIRVASNTNNSPYLTNLRDSVNALMDQPALLMQPGEDFELAYGTSIQPENRNIGYLSNYVQTSREDRINQDFYQYMGARRDPRINYYFYNQASANSDLIAFPLPTPGGITPAVKGIFATVPLGSTNPNASSVADNLYTLPGLYTAGGRYNDGSGPANANSANGAAPQRFLPSFNRRFIEAELQLTQNNDAVKALAAYQAGIAEAFAKVNTIAAASGQTNALPIPAASIAAYTTAATTNFTSATSDLNKLNYILQEKYVASFGFGEDIWTDFRRTNNTLPNSTINRPSVVNADGIGVLTNAPGDVPNTLATGARPNILFYDLNDLKLRGDSAPAQHRPSDKPFWMPQ